MKAYALAPDYFEVLQQINNGIADFYSLAETLRLDTKRLLHILKALRGKRLINMGRRTAFATWIQLTHKGKRLMLQRKTQKPTRKSNRNRMILTRTA